MAQPAQQNPGLADPPTKGSLTKEPTVSWALKDGTTSQTPAQNVRCLLGVPFSEAEEGVL